MTNAIRHGFDAGTRDLSGRPGPNYWQLQVDYPIDAKLDPASDAITGSETIALHNNSPQELNEIVLRLDHNIFRGLVQRGASVPAENTDGMVITKLAVNGEQADLTAAPTGGRRGGGDTGARHAASASSAWIRRSPASRWRAGSRRKGRRRWRSTGTPGCRAAPPAAAIA